MSNVRLTPDDPQSPNPPKDGRLLADLEKMARVEEASVVKDDLSSAEARETIFREVDEICTTLGYSMKEVAAQSGRSASSLSQVRSGTYPGKAEDVLRDLQGFIERSRKFMDAQEVVRFSRTSLVNSIWGALNTGRAMESMPVICAESGMGKTTIAKAYEQLESGVTYIYVEHEGTGKDEISRQLCEVLTSNRGHRELMVFRDKPFNVRHGAIKRYLSTRLNTMFLVDEAQRQTLSALEYWRAISDNSDPAGRRKIVVAFLGDERFLNTIKQVRDGGRSARMTAQLTSRMFPLVNLTEHIVENGGVPFSVEDVLSMVKGSKLRVLTRDSAEWLAMLANVSGFGHLRLALTVLRAAAKFNAKKLKAGTPLSVDDLAGAFMGAVGSEAVAKQIDFRAGGRLLAKAG